MLQTGRLQTTDFNANAYLITEKIYLSNTKHDVTTSTFFTYARPIKVLTKVHFKILQFLVVMYMHDISLFTLCYRRCQNGSGLFSLFKHFLETEMSKSPRIIIKQCIFKNQNLCFASHLRMITEETQFNVNKEIMYNRDSNRYLFVNACRRLVTLDGDKLTLGDNYGVQKNWNIFRMHQKHHTKYYF